MARINIARQQASDAGLVPVYYQASPDGHAVKNSDGRIVLHVINRGEAEVVVIVKSGLTVGGLKLQDREVVVAPGESAFIGPLDGIVYNQSGTSETWIDYSTVGGVDVAALLIP